MKTKTFLSVICSAALLCACNESELDPNSIFDNQETEAVRNEFDKWILTNYVWPYNIQLKYRFEDKESDMGYNVIPASMESSIALAKVVKFLWLESYGELCGPTFIRTYCPKMLAFVGSPEYETNGSVVMATAEGGLKITVYNVNNIDPEHPNYEQMNENIFHTIHHEFAHILHQNKEFSSDFSSITAPYYQGPSWVNVDQKSALDMGFITPYASSETHEDFVEILSTYITESAGFGQMPHTWEERLALASAFGREMLNQKLAIVRYYMLTAWGIDIDQLRSIIKRRNQEVVTLDLTTLN